jgi:hypothetical protein
MAGVRAQPVHKTVSGFFYLLGKESLGIKKLERLAERVRQSPYPKKSRISHQHINLGAY